MKFILNFEFFSLISSQPNIPLRVWSLNIVCLVLPIARMSSMLLSSSNVTFFFSFKQCYEIRTNNRLDRDIEGLIQWIIESYGMTHFILRFCFTLLHDTASPAKRNNSQEWIFSYPHIQQSLSLKTQSPQGDQTSYM